MKLCPLIGDINDSLSATWTPRIIPVVCTCAGILHNGNHVVSVRLTGKPVGWPPSAVWFLDFDDLIRIE